MTNALQSAPSRMTTTRNYSKGLDYNCAFIHLDASTVQLTTM